MTAKKQSFEKAMEKLEGLVEKLEEGNLSLDKSLAAFEEGMQLAQYCDKQLSEASGKVQKIMKDVSGAESLVNLSEDELDELKG